MKRLVGCVHTCSTPPAPSDATSRHRRKGTCDKTWPRPLLMSALDPPEAVMSPADLHRDETIDSHLLARNETENGGIERRWIVSVHGVSGIGYHHRLGNVLALSHRLVHCAVSLRAPLSIQQ